MIFPYFSPLPLRPLLKGLFNTEFLINSPRNPMIFGYVLGGVRGCFGGMFESIWRYFGRFLEGKNVENYVKKIKIR